MDGVRLGQREPDPRVGDIEASETGTFRQRLEPAAVKARRDGRFQRALLGAGKTSPLQRAPLHPPLRDLRGERIFPQQGVVMEAHARALSVLTENRPLLDIVATQLLERETLTRDDILLLKSGKELPPRLPPSVPASPTLPPPPLVPAPRAVPPLLGGPEVSPA